MCRVTDQQGRGVVAGAPPASGQCLVISPELCNHLQTIVNNFEVLAALDLPADARACLGRLDRAVTQVAQLIGVRCLLSSVK